VKSARRGQSAEIGTHQESTPQRAADGQWPIRVSRLPNLVHVHELEPNPHRRCRPLLDMPTGGGHFERACLSTVVLVADGASASASASASAIGVCELSAMVGVWR
jgi:hypothetical protein